MPKLRNLIFWSSLFILPELLTVIVSAVSVPVHYSFYTFVGITAALLLIWFGGSMFVLFRKRNSGSKQSKLLTITALISISMVALLLILSLITGGYPYTGDFSITTPVYKNKNVLVIVPHQDDDINLVGGLVEPYIQNNSEVSVAFTTNGDFEFPADVRSKEVLNALTPLGIPKENIYYSGFGDQWEPQSDENFVYEHIYCSPDPDTLWTSHYGATETYDTTEIDCYLKLPYTKNNYLHSIKSIILDKKPDVIFATDFDEHIDHKGTSLLFEEAMGQILKENPDYHPTVYKGFCYGTAWTATNDFYDDVHLLSTQKPNEQTWSETSCTYRWEDRLRFAVGVSNLNPILSNNSVFTSMDAYRVAEAYNNAPNVLNGDKVFWERRTDSLLYDAQIWVEDQQTDLLNDFQLIDTKLLYWKQDIREESEFCGAVRCGQNQTIRMELPEAVTANCLYLYDHPSLQSNILAGRIVFSDGLTLDFSELEQDGSVTKIAFPTRELNSLEITVTQAEGDCPGLTEIELYCDEDTQTESFLMAVDQDDNFVYDYILQGEDSVAFEIRQFPDGAVLDSEQVDVTFEATGSNSQYTWEEGRLRIRCGKNETCSVTISKDGTATTFTVSNPYAVKIHMIQLLRKVDDLSIRSEALLRTVSRILEQKLGGIFNR